MKRAGGGVDAAYNEQTAVDEAAHIIVAAELTTCAGDAAELPKVLQAIQANLGQSPKQVLADTGYRSEAVFAAPPNSWIKSVLGFRQFSLRGLHRVSAVWKLVCAALNLRRMCAVRPA